MDAIAALGGHIARLAISARIDIDYHMGSACIAGFTLASAMQNPDVKKAIDNPAISVFILTSYDGATFGDCVTHNYLNPRYFTPAKEAEVVQEYSDLALYLSQTYQHVNKRFIISNWESDNDVYCGQAWLYTADARFRATCDASYPGIYAGNSTPAESFQGLRLWFQARELGIEDGRNRALALGIGGVRVYFAPEVNIVRYLHGLGLQSTLYDVVPFVKFDYVSYSSHQSLGQSDPQGALLQDLETIQSLIGSSPIIIGEIMTASPGVDPTVFDQTLRQVLDEALAWGVPYVIYWNLFGGYDSPRGVYDTAGQITPVGSFFKRYLLGERCSIVITRPPPPSSPSHPPPPTPPHSN